MLYLDVHVCIVHTVYENAVIFSSILNMGPHSCIGAPAYEAPGRVGGDEGGVRGLSAEAQFPPP